MRKAIYYPEATVQSSRLVKSALLMWDSLEFIVPDAGYRPHYNNGLVARAMELFGSALVPSDKEKAEAHRHVVEMIERKVPPAFRLRRGGGGSYDMFPQKLLPETWTELTRASAARKLRASGDYHLTEPAGLTVMSILADCCAGSARARVTDRGDAYASLSQLLINESPEEEFHREAGEGLVPFELQIADIDKLTLKQLIEFREREERERGHTLRDLRHRYVDNMSKYLDRILRAQTRRDVGEIRRQYIDDMRTDLGQLKDEISLAKGEVIFAKDAVVPLLGGAALAAAIALHLPYELPSVLGPGGIVATLWGAFGLRNKYTSARRNVLQRHPMAYLYELHG